jgi:hypothetical protein
MNAVPLSRIFVALLVVWLGRRRALRHEAPVSGRVNSPESTPRTHDSWAAPRPTLATPPVRARTAVLGFVGVVAVFWLSITGSALPSATYYTTAAQIIPVLIVALAVETRVRSVWDPMPALLKAQLVIALVVGEATAIFAASGISSGAVDPDEFDRGLVGPTETASEVMTALTTCGLIAGVLAVVVALRGQQRARTDRL